MNSLKIRNIVRLIRRILKAIIGKDLFLFSDCNVKYELLGSDYSSYCMFYVLANGEEFAFVRKEGANENNIS